MQFGTLPFMMTDWTAVPATEHRGAAGVAVWRTVEAGDVRVRTGATFTRPRWMGWSC